MTRRLACAAQVAAFLSTLVEETDIAELHLKVKCSVAESLCMVGLAHEATHAHSLLITRGWQVGTFDLKVRRSTAGLPQTAAAAAAAAAPAASALGSVDLAPAPAAAPATPVESIDESLIYVNSPKAGNKGLRSLAMVANVHAASPKLACTTLMCIASCWGRWDCCNLYCQLNGQHCCAQVGIFRRGKYAGGKRVGKGNLINVGDQVKKGQALAYVEQLGTHFAIEVRAQHIGFRRQNRCQTATLYDLHTWHHQQL